MAKAPNCIPPKILWHECCQMKRKAVLFVIQICEDGGILSDLNNVSEKFHFRWNIHLD